MHLFKAGLHFKCIQKCSNGCSKLIMTISEKSNSKSKAIYPRAILPDAYFLGYNSPLSYGGNSWFVTDPKGNWMIDSPRFVPHLIEKIKELGGLKYIFLTHRDDVAEAHRYAKEFGAERIIHKYDKDAQPHAEIIIEGEEAKPFASDFLIIPVPGHTRGHMVLLWKNLALFTGDHLALDRKSGKPYAFPDYCWYSWEKQTESMKSLLNYSFEWILCGHGQWGHLPREEMHKRLAELVKEMGS